MRQSWSGIHVALCVLSAGLCGCSESPHETSAGTAAFDTQTETLPIDERATIRVDNAMAGWLPTGIEVEAGDGLALFASGAWEVQGLKLAPRHVLWYRIGEDGPATNLRADQDAFDAHRGGPLFLTLRPLGVYWDDARGTYPPGFSEAPAIPVNMAVDVVRFRTPATEGLRRLANAGEAAAEQAQAALKERNTLPTGFSYLPYLGRSNVWSDNTVDGRPGIHAETTDDVGIVKLPLDIPLDATTQLRFDWRYDDLPALGPETEPQNHDYLSIALEFDNGQDLTWMWSPYLEAGSHFGCPLPWWDSRETHFVIQSGRDDLGKWFSHSRNVLADYRNAIALADPERIVGVWFIANSLFGRQRAAASFANVSVTDGDTEVVVFADR